MSTSQIPPVRHSRAEHPQTIEGDTCGANNFDVSASRRPAPAGPSVSSTASVAAQRTGVVLRVLLQDVAYRIRHQYRRDFKKTGRAARSSVRCARLGDDIGPDGDDQHSGGGAWIRERVGPFRLRSSQ